MNVPSSAIVVVWGRRKINWNPNHGGNHLSHLVWMGISATSLDILPFEVEQEGAITHVRWTIQEYLRSGAEKPRWVLISTPDEYHIADLRTCVEEDVWYILVEKPIGLNNHDYAEFSHLHALAQKKWQIILSCLPRLMDAPYRHLSIMIPELVNLYGKITKISHTFWFHKDTNKGSAGQDHIAHEITAIMKLLGFTGNIEEAITRIEYDSADKYMCCWRIADVDFTVGGNKKSPEKYEKVGIEFENGKLELDALSGKLAYSLSWDHPMEHNIGKSSPVDRLTGVTRNFVDITLGTKWVELYLPNNGLIASAFSPRHLPGQIM